MRPVKKWPVGYATPNGSNIQLNYTPYGSANLFLEQNLDSFCSYCEVFDSNLEVEHIISKHQNINLSTQWDNFLRSCRRCNGSDNKSNKSVDLNQIYFPHQNNTFLAFEYCEGGMVKLHPSLINKNQKDKAFRLLKLIGLDKYPGNPDYPTTEEHPHGFPIRDTRWSHRRRAWELAQIKLVEYNANRISAADVAKLAEGRGFFSVWFSVFSAHNDVKEKLIHTFTGTDLSCFDENFNPIPRNPSNTSDQL